MSACEQHSHQLMELTKQSSAPLPPPAPTSIWSPARSANDLSSTPIRVMETLLTTCLSKICEEMDREPDLHKKMKLVDDVTEFLLSTPDVFSSSDLTWRRFLYSTITHLLSNKIPAKDRKKVFKLISSLVLGFGRINWFMAEDGDWREQDVKYFNLLSRYTCIEIVMLLDGQQDDNIDSDFLGCVLIILEHCLMCLVECDAVSSGLTPSQISALIVAIRSAAITLIEFADLHKDDQELTLIIRSMIRLISLWIREDNEGVTVHAGNMFASVVIAVLTRSQAETTTTSSHDLLHAAIAGITDLPSECAQTLSGRRNEISDLMSLCQQDPGPESSCSIVYQSLTDFMSQETDTSRA